MSHNTLQNLHDNLPDDTHPAGTALDPAAGDDVLLEAQTRLLRALTRLHQKHLLRPSTTMTLIRNFHNNVPVHRLRAAPLSDQTATQWDNNLYTFISTLLDATNTATLRTLTHLPQNLGGLGIHDTNTRRHAALLTAWRQTAHNAHDDLCASTEHDWALNNPTTRKHILDAAAQLQPMTNLTLDVDWAHWIGTPAKHTQKQIMQDVYDKKYTKLLTTMTTTHQAVTRSAGGKGAAAWMYPPADATTHMPRKHYLTAMRYRTHTPTTYTHTSNLCQHTNTKRTCLHPLDAQGHHAVTCQIGGQPTQKHDHLRDILYKWLVKWGFFSQREQHIPELDDTDHEGKPRQAILDIYTTINDRQYLIDISVTDAVSDCPVRTNSRSSTDATAAMEREQQKRTRYQNDPRLVPFVFEVGGRWGPTAEAWIKTIAPTDPDERATALAQLRYELSTSLQRSNADMIITAHH